MTNLKELLENSTKTGVCKAEATANGILKCSTVSTGKVWFMPVTTFVARIASHEIEILSEDTFRFARKDLKDTFEGK